MNFQLFEDLRNLEHITVHPGATSSAFDTLKNQRQIVLPSDHENLLRRSNGIEAYAGYIRLFGIDTTESIDALRWNESEYWKFAWGTRCTEYWCLAETAWGDQYAYSSQTLRAGGNSEIYFLDAFSMKPQAVASSFADFFEKEFLRSSRQPYDIMIEQARQKLGPLEVSSHLVYMPSILLGGIEDIQHVSKMNARAAMICNGDIALQLEDAPVDGKVKGVQSYEDELRRMRLRLVWA
jgi:hypothetical protein